MEANILGLNNNDFGNGLESLLQLLEPLSEDQNKYEEAFGMEPTRSVANRLAIELVLRIMNRPVRSLILGHFTKN